MSKILALLAIVLILSGALLLAVPREGAQTTTRSVAPEALAAQSLIIRAREIAEVVQAPLSIAFGIISLYWNRKNYLKQQRSGGSSA
jgi:hypothetical protein